MSHCKPCEVCPIVDLCIQAVMDKPCPLDEDDNSTTNIKKYYKGEQVKWKAILLRSSSQARS